MPSTMTAGVAFHAVTAPALSTFPREITGISCCLAPEVARMLEKREEAILGAFIRGRLVDVTGERAGDQGCG